MKIPDKLPRPAEADRLADIAYDLVDGHESRHSTYPEIQSAVYYVPGHDAEDGKYPSLKVSVPKEEYANQYAWRAEYVFGNQDPALSTHILVRKDGTVAFSDYSGQTQDQEFNKKRLSEFRAHLESIKDNLIPDIDYSNIDTDV